MKVTRSYWLGLGSGLILSALLTIVFSPLQGQAEAPKDTSLVTGVQKEPLNSPEPNADADPDLDTDTDTDPEKPVAGTQPTQVDQTTGQSATLIDRQFVIPKGASAERIAELLMAEGFITDKDTFLKSARQLRYEKRFRAGSFTLSVNLTTEELLHRLVKS